MGAIKDVIDLLKDLNERVNDRKIVEDLGRIQALILNIQSDNASLHESNIELRDDLIARKEEIVQLESTIKELETQSDSTKYDGPTCPNCSTSSKPLYMSSLPLDISNVGAGTHMCPKCKFIQDIRLPK